LGWLESSGLISRGVGAYAGTVYGQLRLVLVWIITTLERDKKTKPCTLCRRAGIRFIWCMQNCKFKAWLLIIPQGICAGSACKFGRFLYFHNNNNLTSRYKCLWRKKYVLNWMCLIFFFMKIKVKIEFVAISKFFC